MFDELSFWTEVVIKLQRVIDGVELLQKAFNAKKSVLFAFSFDMLELPASDLVELFDKLRGVCVTAGSLDHALLIESSFLKSLSGYTVLSRAMEAKSKKLPKLLSAWIKALKFFLECCQRSQIESY